ncbi:TonB family protein [Phenylobacterium sp. VNQ135]|uniref:TonB family protein n=1 Tax=Phenylobacterium sp. VNQ135 TaxID=3400922 RepID=UPI003C0B8018
MIGLVTALALALAQADVPAPPAAEPLPVEGRDWVRRPSARDAAMVYPRGHKREQDAGAALVECKVEAAGTLANCQVLAEQPEGQGFGDMALKLVPKFRLKKQLKDGRPTEGGSVRIPMGFRRF